jgi:predicted RNA methylase
MTQISDAARAVLSNVRIEGTILYLPPGHLARLLYEEVNKVLERLGGKWKGGKVRGHIFDSDPSEDMQVLVQTGEMPPKNPLAFFATPIPVILEMLHDPGLPRIPETAKRILEPSAGTGNIAVQVMLYCKAHDIEATIDCCEIVPMHQERLQQQRFPVVAADFLDYHPGAVYDAILMNPPFSTAEDNLAYITHILHAWELLAPHGILIAIAPAGLGFRNEKKVRDFRMLIDANGGWQRLPSESFKESGTGVETTILALIKPAVQVAEEIHALIDKIPARAIPSPVQADLDGAYKLTQAIEKAVARQVPPDVPVFGDPDWISRARTRGRKSA